MGKLIQSSKRLVSAVDSYKAVASKLGQTYGEFCKRVVTRNAAPIFDGAALVLEGFTAITEDMSIVLEAGIKVLAPVPESEIDGVQRVFDEAFKAAPAKDAAE